MSRSLGTAIGLAETAYQEYGKLMSISDNLIWRYYEILLHTTSEQIVAMKVAVEKRESHPMELKKKMAHAVVARFWVPQEADMAQARF